MNLKLVRDNLSSFEFIKTSPGDAAVFMDIDGTISEIASSPEAAVVAADMRRILEKLAGRYLVAVVSGRSTADARSMVGSDNIIYIGGHGLERLHGGVLTNDADDEGISAVARVRDELLPLAESLKGVRVEDKGIAFALHYREAADEEEAGRKLGEASRRLAASNDVEVIFGRKVIEFKVTGGDKGRAVAAELENSGRRNLLFIGDDMTDVSAFKRLKELRKSGEADGFALGVISDETPEAVCAESDYVFTSVTDVKNFLEWLA